MYTDQDNWSGESYELESSENEEFVPRVEFELEITPKKKSRGKDEYIWPSERNYKPMKN